MVLPSFLCALAKPKLEPVGNGGATYRGGDFIPVSLAEVTLSQSRCDSRKVSLSRQLPGKRVPLRGAYRPEVIADYAVRFNWQPAFQQPQQTATAKTSL